MEYKTSTAYRLYHINSSDSSNTNHILKKNQYNFIQYKCNVKIIYLFLTFFNTYIKINYASAFKWGT